MKTTLDLPDALLLQAKKLAADEHRTLTSLVAEGLRRVLASPDVPGGHERRIRWVVAEGGVPPETADRSALYDWMERPS